MKFKKISISPKLFLASFLPLMFVGLFACISFVKITNDIIKGNVTEQAAGSLSIAESHVNDMFSYQMANLNLVANVAKTTGSKEMIDITQKAAASGFNSTQTFYYVTTKPLSESDGYLIMSDDWKAPSTFSQFERPWYKNAINSNSEMFVFDQYMNTRVNKYCIAVSRAVINSNNGQAIGVCGFDIGLDTLQKITGFVKFSKNSTIAIVDKKGRYLACKDESAVLIKNYFEEKSIPMDGKTLDEMISGTESKVILDDKNIYGVKKIGFTPWYIVVDAPISDFNTSFKKNVFLVIIFVFVICFICTLFLLWYMEKNRTKEKQLGVKLYAETQNLVVAAKENAATSQDQSAAVKEIVATMEDNNALSENISSKIKDVNAVANKTSHDVAGGVASLEENVEKLHEIFDANQNTIDGIKALGEKIENIWDIVTLINSVADQAKIIAFNAELEASSAGEAGKNFHIVATEIRRLADGIIDGTKEIKEKITEIQQSSDSLVLASESGTAKINEGCENAKILEEKFESIKNASEITAGSAEDITSIIQQQALASEQILITLKQIAAGVENFTQATESISTAAQNVQEISEELNTDQNKNGGAS